MVSRSPLSRAGDRVGYTLLVVAALVMAWTGWMLYRVYERQGMILYVLNGGCL